MRSLSVFSLVFLLACSSASSDAPPPGDVPPAEPADIHGTFHFFSNGAEVTKIIYTDPFEVRLEGVPAGAKVDLLTRTYSPSAKGEGYSSKVTFVADASGAISTKTMAPIAGSYTGVDPDGIIWSMTAGKLAEGLGPDRAAAFFHAEIDGKAVADGSLGRLVVTEGTRSQKVTDDGLVGVYYVPPNVTNEVPVLCFGGSEGGISGGEFYAARFASMGHPALGVAYFGAPGVPSDLDNVPLEYFQKALAWLDKQPETRKGKAVVVGGSRGGELALLLGATLPGVVGVIAETPSSYRWAGLAPNGDAAWTWQGQPLPFLDTMGSSFDQPPTKKMPDGRDAWVLRPMFEKTLATTSADKLEAARIAVENTQGPLLMIGGSDDQMWPACDFIDRAMKRLGETGHAAKFGDEGVCFPDAGHWVGSVGLPTTDSMFTDLGSDAYALGGTPAGNARSGRPVEAKMKALLAKVSATN